MNFYFTYVTIIFYFFQIALYKFVWSLYMSNTQYFVILFISLIFISFSSFIMFEELSVYECHGLFGLLSVGSQFLQASFSDIFCEYGFPKRSWFLRRIKFYQSSFFNIIINPFCICYSKSYTSSRTACP